MDITVQSLSYDLIQERVFVAIVGNLGGRDVQIQVQFRLRPPGHLPETRLRELALEEAQQILRAAATVSLPPRIAKPKSDTDTTGRASESRADANQRERAVGSWDNEGGAPRAGDRSQIHEAQAADVAATAKLTRVAD
jgi:hypothetical protein